MPVYEYECKNCGLHFEVMCSITDRDEEVKCRVCESKKCERVYSGSFTCSSDFGISDYSSGGG